MSTASVKRRAIWWVQGLTLLDSLDQVWIGDKQRPKTKSSE
jgi:hypothetical protein